MVISSGMVLLGSPLSSFSLNRISRIDTLLSSLLFDRPLPRTPSIV